jgi:hypothetical protein
MIYLQLKISRFHRIGNHTTTQHNPIDLVLNSRMAYHISRDSYFRGFRLTSYDPFASAIVAAATGFGESKLKSALLAPRRCGVETDADSGVSLPLMTGGVPRAAAIGEETDVEPEPEPENDDDDDDILVGLFGSSGFPRRKCAGKRSSSSGCFDEDALVGVDAAFGVGGLLEELFLLSSFFSGGANAFLTASVIAATHF